jgi:hypothetical protein
MKTIIAALLVVCAAASLSSCNLVEQITPTQLPRYFSFSYKKLPPGITLAAAKVHMERRRSSPLSDSILTFDADTYANKTDNTASFTLQAIPQGTTQGRLDIRVRDAILSHLERSGHIGSTGATILAIPMPTVGDTVRSAELRFFITEDGASEAPAEYANLNDPNSYFRLVLKSNHRYENTGAVTDNTATGWFEGLVQATSGPHAGEIFAITDGGFSMDVAN